MKRRGSSDHKSSGHDHSHTSLMLPPAVLGDVQPDAGDAPTVGHELFSAHDAGDAGSAALNTHAVLEAQVEALACSGFARDIVERCCREIIEHNRAYMRAQLAGLRHALAAGEYAIVIKGTVGHGNFRAVCEEQMPTISFRRIEQFKWLAENKEELLILLRAENAQHGAPLSDEELLASASIRKAQRLLVRNVDEGAAKRRTKKRHRQPQFATSQPAADNLLTPESVLAATLALLGTIDIDPCADTHLPNHVPALKRLTAEEDGLDALVTWNGAALIHPPVHQIAEWVAKAQSEFAAGRLREAVLLVPAQTNAAWFVTLADHPRAFIRERIVFPTPRGRAVESLHPYAVIFLGKTDRAADFASAFADIADTYQPILRAKVALLSDE
jgi:hypothetical protein